MAALPWADPQFLAVTGVALAAGVLALRPFLARRKRATGPACPRCANCATAQRHQDRAAAPVVRIGRG